MIPRSCAALLVLSLAARAAPEAPAIDSGLMAVLELTNKLKGADRELIDRNYFSDVVRREALRAVPRLNLMTRENMEVLAHNMGLSLEQCDEAQCVDTGRKLGADTVINGDILKVGSRFKIILRLHETKSGRLLSIGEASGKDVDELDANTGQAVKELFAPLVPQEKRSEPPPRVEAAPRFEPPPVQAAPQQAFSACPSGMTMLAGDCKPVRLLRTAMKICPYESTFAFCNDEDGNITENAFISKYKSVTGQANLDRNWGVRRSTMGPAFLTALGITGIVVAWVAMKCTQADITNNNCPGQNTSALNTQGFVIFMGSVVGVAAGVGWAAWAIIHADGTPDDHNISPELARASVDEYNRKLH